MSIFQIKKLSDGQKVSTIEGVTDNTTNDLQDEKKELEQAQKVAGSVPVGSEGQAEGQGTTVSEEDGKTFSLKPGEKEVVVKVDGPLGRVFTEALNKMLATENLVVMPLTEDDLRLRQEEDSSFNDEILINVIAYDANELQSSDVVDVTNEIVKRPDTQYVIAMETIQHRGRVSNAVGLVESLCQGNKKIKSCYHLNTAVNLIMERLK